MFPKLLLYVFFLLLFLNTEIQAAPLTFESTRLSAHIEGAAVGLEAFIARPALEGRFPVALITHGSSDTPEKLSAQEELGNWALDFAARGYLAVAVLRRGYGNSDGVVNQMGGSCESPTPDVLLQHDADDLEAALKAMASRPDADMSKVIAIGQSRGGADVLALSARPQAHLTAVISVSGGVYHLDKGSERLPFHVYDNCTSYRDKLIAALGDYASKAPMPQLWVYEENDPWFQPDIVHSFQKAWTDHGGNAQVNLVSPRDINGHQLFFSPQGRAILHPMIDAFLRDHGLPSWDMAATDTLRKQLTRQQNAELDTYLIQGTAERALAMAKDGTGHLHYNEGRGISDRARRPALKICEDTEHKPCKLLMANFDVLPQTVSDDKSE